MAGQGSYPIMYASMKDTIDWFQIKARRIDILNHILNQSQFDDTLDVDEKTEFRDSLQKFAITAEWCYDNNYHLVKVLRRIPFKLYKALHHKRGALQLTALMKSMEDAHQNESRMIDLMI